MEDMTTITQMHWKPKLMRLTSIYPQYTEPVFIDPTHVSYIAQTKPKSVEDETETLPVCTLIYYSGSLYTLVKESTEEVARLCDEAFGHKWDKTVRYLSI